jgi:quercetin dioxygenase-like cupin family protein
VTEFTSGNIFIRPMRFANAGEMIQSHDHPFDHTTIVFRGKVRVRATYPDGNVGQQDVEAPAHLLIEAGVRHELTALTDDTVVWCVYSHRNAQGEVVQAASEATPDSYNSGMPDAMRFRPGPLPTTGLPRDVSDRLVIHRHE